MVGCSRRLLTRGAGFICSEHAGTRYMGSQFRAIDFDIDQNGIVDG